MSKEKSQARLKYEAAIALLPESPASVKSQTGCKVSWHWFATLEDAQIASQYAYHRGVWNQSMGYDFGYCSPGDIARDGELYKVTYP